MLIRALPILLSLLVLPWFGSVASADLPGERGISIEYNDGTIIESGATTVILTGGDFIGTSNAGGSVVFSVGANVTELGQTIGDVGTEFADPTIMPYAVVGGTAATDSLKFKPTSSATISTGTVKFCGDTPSMTGNATCLSVIPDGATLATNATIATGIMISPAYTQTTNAGFTGLLPAGYAVNFTPSLKITDSALGAGNFGALFGVGASATMTNSTDDDYASGSIHVFSGAWSGTKTSTGLTSLSGVTFASTITAPGTGVTYISASAGAIDFLATDFSGTVSGTVTNHWGFLAEAFTKGTAAYQFGAGENTDASITTFTSPPANYMGWGMVAGVTSNADRFYTKNAAGHVWRMGYLTMTGRGTALATTAVTRFFPVTGTLAADATETNADIGIPGAIKAYGITCGLNVAAGAGTDAHAITLMDDTVATALTCTITTTANNCQSRSETGVTIAVPSLIDYKDVTTDTPTANEVTCVLVYNLDVW